MNQSKVRYALVGAGHIAQTAVLPAFEHADSNSKLAAIVSGDAEKREQLGKQYNVDLVGDYEDLDAILGQVDAVYISTPNALHKQCALRAAAARVHVLCEKPLATSVADAELIADACERAGAKLMVAYRLHFEEATLRAIELVRAGRIGEPRIFSSVFGHVVRPGDIRTRAEMGGGALLDLGVYCINAARSLFSAEPTLAFAVSHKSNGVDQTTTAVLQFPGNRVAQFTVSNDMAGVSSYRICGTEGDLRVEPGYEYAEALEHHLTVDGKTTTKTFAKRDQFAPELAYFSRCILEDRQPEPDAEEGIADLRVIEAALESAETGKPVPLSPQQRRRRPDLSQEDRRPSVGKQETINAPSPSLR